MVQLGCTGTPVEQVAVNATDAGLAVTAPFAAIPVMLIVALEGEMVRLLQCPPLPTFGNVRPSESAWRSSETVSPVAVSVIAMHCGSQRLLQFAPAERAIRRSPSVVVF